jgi:hypothetical protein
VSKASRTSVLGAMLAVGVGLLLAPAAQAQMQQQGQQGQQPPQAQTPDLQQIWQMQKLQMRARIAGAIEQLRTACGDELRAFCSTVTPGEGRLLLCMQAHEDKIGRQCELALLEALRNIGSAVQRAEAFAKTCWQDIQTYCSGSGGSVAQCMAEKRASLSPACQAMVAAAMPSPQPDAQQPGQPGTQSKLPSAQPTMIGLPIFSADGVALGQVTGLKRRSDGSLEAIEAELGSPLGLGGTSVLISPGELRWRGDGVELQMLADQVRSVLQGQKQ